MKLAIFCSGGFSSSLAGKNIEKGYQNKGKSDVEVEAYDFAMIDDVDTDVSGIILAPQISWAEDQVRNEYPDKKVVVLTMTEFGRMNGDVIVERLISEGLE